MCNFVPASDNCIVLHSTLICHRLKTRYLYYFNILIDFVGTAVVQWLRCCATNRKVAVSIPDGVIGIFH